MTCSPLRRSAALFHTTRAQKDPARFLEKVSRIRTEAARQLSMRGSGAGPKEVLDAVFYCRNDLTPASDVLAATPGLSAEQLRAVFESERAMPENKNNARLKTWYHDAFEIALTTEDGEPVEAHDVRS